MSKKSFRLDGRVEVCLVAHTFNSIVSSEARKIAVLVGEGVRGDQHAGQRLADVREKDFLQFGAKGTPILNLREFSAVSAEELDEIRAALDITEMPLGHLGENLIVSGIPKFSKLPTGTKLFFRKPGGERRTAVLLVHGENMPCILPAEALQRALPETPDIERLFPKAAIGRRGIVGQVFASGFIHKNDEVIALVPEQRIYDPN